MMDEATANIDHETDKLIQKSIKTHFSDSTVIIVAHRLRTILHCNELIVMEKGRCSELGTPRVLAAKETSLFRKYIDNCEEEERNLILSQLMLNK